MGGRRIDRHPPSRRTDPASAFARFLALPWLERAVALDVIFRLHEKLAQGGWVACDFYDGCFIYDFTRRQMQVVDLDNYRDAPFINHMGRMFGSTRFMAPEEHELGARIDERTTVFALGRTLQQFLASGTESLASRACETNPQLRFGSVRDFYKAWSACLTAAAEASHAGAGTLGGPIFDR
jgi:serine/threonine protein kinase, bacterial